MKVELAYHVPAGRHLYSAPYRLVVQQVEVHLTATTVASHVRRFLADRATATEHRSKAHKEYPQWTSSRLLSRADFGA
jgi:hypothetical protein